jgi:NADH:ubiquinone reductase (non-electrogenic)
VKTFAFGMWKRTVGTLGVAIAATPLLLAVVNDETDDILYKTKSFLFPPSWDGEKKHVVVLGTGWAALSLLSRLPSYNTRVTVISPRPYFFYTPLLAGVTTGSVKAESIQESVRRHLLHFDSMETTYLQGSCEGVDFKEKKCNVQCDGISTQVSYDKLVVAVGADVNTFNIPGVSENSMFMKEVPDALRVQKKVLTQLEKANALLLSGKSQEDIEKHLHWVIIGGGPTGVELAAELSDFVAADVKQFFPRIAHLVQITLIEATPRILGTFDPHVANYAEAALRKQGASVLTQTMVCAANDHEVSVKDARSGEKRNIPYGALVWAGGVAARTITKQLGKELGQEEGGRPVRGLKVDDKFHIVGAEDAYAIGDCSLVQGCAPTAQAAFQQGKFLGKMLRDTGYDVKKENNCESFQFINMGSLAYIGASEGVAELKTHLWDRHPQHLEKIDVGSGHVAFEGGAAFTLWRSLYFSKMMSVRNRWLVGFDWMMGGMGQGRTIACADSLPPSEHAKA